MDLDEHRYYRAVGAALGGILPIGVGAALVPLRTVTDNANIALCLVVVVVLAAVVGGRITGMVAAGVSTLTFDFFHARPYLSLSIAGRDDIETAALLLLVGLSVGAVTTRGWRARAAAQLASEEIHRIHRVADRVAAGHDVTEVIGAVQTELTGLLGLKECRFEASPNLECFPRLERSGVIEGPRVWRVAPGGFELPMEGVEVPVLARGHQVARFVLYPRPNVGVSLEQRIVALAIVDQVAAALTGAGPRGPLQSPGRSSTSC